MKPLIVFAAAIQFAGWGQQVLGDEKDRVLLERKLVGAWEGQAGCVGDLLIRKDGTYERTGYGPVGFNSEGVWAVRWTVRPPTLILSCQMSDFQDEIGKNTEAKVVPTRS